MSKPLSHDEAIALARSKARLAQEQARARRERVRADLAEGNVIPLADAQAQINGLAAAVRRHLDLAPSYLPPDISPDVRKAAKVAMEHAINKALDSLSRDEIRKEIGDDSED